MYSVLLAFGTRPEAIKLAPVYAELKRRSDRIRLICCVTGQHRSLLDPVLDLFDIKTDYDLNIIKENQSLCHITSSVLLGMKDVLEAERPDLLVVQGDTTSAFSAALSAFYLHIPVAHVEAGLRSYDRLQPFPEEVNRVFVSHITDLNFCPTERAAQNLLKENIPESSIHVTGNTVIDALLAAAQKIEAQEKDYVKLLDLPPGRLILVTGHRRENFDGGLANLSLALVDLAQKYPDVVIVYSVHPNPNVRSQVERILGSHPRIRLIPPPDYLGFVALMKSAYFIITDSGGIQEEAPSLKKPVLIVRNLTERPEAVECGAAVLVGTDRERIVSQASALLEDPARHAAMIPERSPFGDGRASERIADLMEEFLDARKKKGGP
jgi:UDP-N-acetylglucosamine 2-epimerase (non-hydrolysing)